MSSKRKFLIRLAILCLATLFTFTGSGCSKSDAPAGKGKGNRLKFPVEVATVSTRSGSLQINAVGAIEAFEIVQVTARVPGAVQKVRFKEGAMVRTGDALAEIEPERYELAVKSSEASLEKAKASRREAEAGLARRMDIQGKNPGFVSPEDLQNWQTKALSAQADSAQADVNLELARLNLRNALVPAPVSGMIQSRAVRTGQYVVEGTLIATMLRRDPLLLKFTVSDQDAKHLYPKLDLTFRVRGETTDYKATISAVEESADPMTRMVNITAEVTDPQQANLRPGSFAEVTILLGESKDLPVIPQISIRPSERGFVAYVVSDSVAHERILTIGLQSADGYVEVTDGLKSGETVVIRGSEALTDGAAVRIISSGQGDSSAVKSKPGKKS
jgi:membrane fusion protein, multidrug efflux system